MLCVYVRRSLAFWLIRRRPALYVASHIILCGARLERIWPPQSVGPISKNPVSAAVATRPEHKANVFSKMFGQFRFVGQIATYAAAPGRMRTQKQDERPAIRFPGRPHHIHSSAPMAADASKTSHPSPRQTPPRPRKDMPTQRKTGRPQRGRGGRKKKKRCENHCENEGEKCVKNV